MVNKKYLYVLVAFLILAVSHGVYAADPVGDVVLSKVYPSNQEANYNPQLSVNIQDPQNAPLTVIFESNVTGTWQALGDIQNGLNGVYTLDSTGMNVKNKKYFWRVRVYDGTAWTNNTYSFTAVAFALKWTAQLQTNANVEISPLAADVNNDGIYEVFAISNTTLESYDGATGKLLWRYTSSSIEAHAPIDIGDLNNDGIPEIITASRGRVQALHANDGSVYWNVPMGAQDNDKHNLILDTDGNNLPYVYAASSDITNGSNGTGRLKKLDGRTGATVAEVFAWRPCSGGLSAADPDNSGHLIIYMCDRREGYEPSPGGLGKGMQAYDADTLKLLWYKPDITCSSHMQMLIDDMDGDGVMESVAMFQSTNGGICIVNAKTGVPLPGKCQNGLGLSTDSAPTIYDIDGDGHLELITSRYSTTKVWDLTDWKLDAELNYSINSPRVANVIGDDKLELIIGYYDTFIYGQNYSLIERIPTTKTSSETMVQDIDNDGQNELMMISPTGFVRVYDTSGYAPTPKVRTNNLEYSERRLAAGVYVPIPGAPQPFIKEETPANGSVITNLNPKLSFHAVDYRHDKLDIDISTDASGSWQNVGSYRNVTNGIYNYTPTNMNKEDTTYNWKVTVVDSQADNITVTKLFSFNTAANDSTATRPIIRNISPASGIVELPVNISQISFDLFDNQNDKMNYSVTTSPNIGTGAGINVGNGHYVVNLHNVSSTTTYTWKISVTDGKEWRNKTFNFTTKFECVDADHDGINATGGICGVIDCNDAVASVHQNAVEICGNGIDEDCSGADKACLLSDSTFDASADSADLRANSPIQDWYESRGAFPTGADPTLLSLDTANVGGNNGKKALLKANVNTSTNAYMAQEFGEQQNNSFNVSFDVYIDSIDGTSTKYNRTGTVYVGDDSNNGNAPTGTGSERFVSIGFYDPTPGDTGNDIYLRAQPLGASFTNTNAWINVTSDLSYDTWYNVKLAINPVLGTYDIYVNNVLKQTNIPKASATAKLSYISFVADSDARGAFYIDNVKGSDFNNATVTCTDADGDGYGLNCALGIDCNDANPAIHPNALDTNCNNVDENCNGLVDDGYVSNATSCGVGACSATGLMTCTLGVETNTCTAGIPALTDATCNNVDDNCNGLVDDGFVSTPTSCGVGACSATGLMTCTLGVTTNTCTAGTPVTEICSNDLDDNCDGTIDNGCSSSEWSYRKQITIDHTKVTADQSNFPVLIDFTDANVGAHAQANGNDLYVTAADGLTKLSFEVESYSAGHVVAWVKVPVLSSSVDTVLYMYYGNPSAVSQETPAAVWDSNYLMVHHLEESSGYIVDSSANDKGGIPTNGVSQNVVGKIDGADSFDGVDDIVVLPKVLTTETQFSFEGWFFADAATQQGAVVSQRGASGALVQYYNGNVYFYVGPNNRNRPASSGVWHYVVGTYDGVNAKLYVDTLAPLNYTTTVSWPNIGTSLGDRVDLARRFKGTIDEVRISNVARSSSYVTTSYNNQNSPNTFATIGSEEPLGNATITCIDVDGDGFSVTGGTCGPIDCNDANPSINPGASDATCNNVDNNCNGLVDDGFVSTPTSCGVGECAATGSLVCSLGVTSNTCTAGTPSTEACDGLDNDCNGVIDNDCSSDPFADWSYRKQITIDHTKVAGTLTDFPVLIDLTDSSLGANAQADGDDIVFTDSNGLTKLPFEVESYSAGHVVAWVKTDVSSTTDTVLYLYYGNPSAVSQETPESVWASNYLAVQHLEESSGSAVDSTSNNNDGTPTNGVTQNVVGKIDGADSFDGVDDIVVLPKVLTTETQFSFEGWFFADAATQQGAVVSQRGSNGALLQYYNGNMYFYVGPNNRNRVASAGVWHYVVGTYDGVNAKLYVDTLAPITYATSVSWPSISTSLGDRVDLTRRFKGTIDEVRISNVARSQAYVTTSYNNQNSPNTFVTLGTEELLGASLKVMKSSVMSVMSIPPADNTPAETPVGDNPVEEIVVEETPLVDGTPIETPIEAPVETPVEETVVEQTPAETSVEETPVEEVPVEETVVNETPAETSVEETPVEEVPVAEEVHETLPEATLETAESVPAQI